MRTNIQQLKEIALSKTHGRLRTQEELIKRGILIDEIYKANQNYDLSLCLLVQYGYFVEELKTTPYYSVVEELIKQGHHIEYFTKSKDADHRALVAKYGHSLEQLANDEHWMVRAEVARYGINLEAMLNDLFLPVRENAIEFKRHGAPSLLN